MADQPTTGKTTFRTVFDVGPDALEQAQGIADTFQHAIAPATVNFDFGEISRVASGIPDSSTVKIVRGWGLQETAPVGVMVLSLREAVRQALTHPFANPVFWEKAEAALTDAFLGLDGQEGTHLSFYGDDPDSTSYYYNLLFALQDEETEGFVHALAFCIDVTVALPAAQAHALTLDDVAPYAIRLNALAVRQGRTGPVAA
ncbi:Type-2Aa cytolytic delta-endotoxin [Streptomyces gilvosporeus]|uniref:Type-2Aa cytolytic delta-endotoxin n=1 Tax=Streptomyces gilvosporeus TaxID=553510 RepID=A0A1V0TLV4_9ACTN|nr:Type-2Aa cytolytic delta-endotoxin [Streptomyces gilvosporeus]ARF53909.1 Type-2Aa cytolytic delta-endotoxin [Streptomyces gilvosporeus]